MAQWTAFPHAAWALFHAGDFQKACAAGLKAAASGSRSRARRGPSTPTASRRATRLVMLGGDQRMKEAEALHAEAAAQADRRDGAARRRDGQGRTRRLTDPTR